VSVLENGFIVEEDVILEPGDVLYMPPRCPHWGTAMKDDGCMTFSVGFRAPKVSELLVGFVEHVSDRKEIQNVFLQDDSNQLMNQLGNPAIISKDAIENARQLLLNAVSNEREFVHWFCEAVTEAKRFRNGDEYVDYEMEENEARETAQELINSEVPSGIHVSFAAAIVTSYLKEDEFDCIQLFINGTRYEMSMESEVILKYLCVQRSQFNMDFILQHTQSDVKLQNEFMQLFTSLLRDGMLYIVDSIQSDSDSDS